MSQVKEVREKKEWEDFLELCQEKTFLHSWHWGEFQKMMGHKIWRLGVIENGQILGAALVIKIKARRGTFLFVPHGPVLRMGNFKSEILNSKQILNYKFQILKNLADYLQNLASKEGASFVRIQPSWERTQENIKIFKDLKFRPSPLFIHPEVTWEVNLQKSQEELLKDMRKTTRNLIKRGLKTQELKVINMINKDGLKIFCELYKATAERQGFIPFSIEYLEKEFEVFSQDGLVSLLLTFYKGQPISGAYIIHWQGGAYYHHGASLPLKEHPATSYILQWQAMLQAKSRGFKTYNFWGIAEDDAKAKASHRYSGLTLFKKGFGGYKKEYVKTQDLITSPLYVVNWVIEVFRRASRRLN